jgi:hypothetical protein
MFKRKGKGDPGGDLDVHAGMLRLAGDPVFDAEKKPRLKTLLSWSRKPVAFTAQATPRRRDRRGDLTVAALGITLGLICAMFPWYIFYNPDKFGPPVIRLGGRVDLRPSNGIGAGYDRPGILLQGEDPAADLDLVSTGTTSADTPEKAREKAAENQPFPGPPVPFKVVHIENGRAMMEDDSGFFIVQRGSVLPDSTRVTAIEQRAGKWVVLTSGDEVMRPAE